ncbi:MAG TPA: hypothetical protein VIL82_05320, partial [Solirubrobacteraceae bacterium]
SGLGIQVANDSAGSLLSQTYLLSASQTISQNACGVQKLGPGMEPSGLQADRVYAPGTFPELRPRCSYRTASEAASAA